MHANTRGFVTALILGAMSVFSACSEMPTGLSDTIAGGRLSGDIDGLAGSPVRVLERSAPRHLREQASRVIGPEGGTIRLKGAGLSVFFPRGAVTQPTDITITAASGKLLGYEFQPHGLQFNVPVTVSQDLDVILRAPVDGQGGPLLIAAYFEGPLMSSVEAKEIRPFRLLGAVGLFEIEHFSGYVIATD